MSQYILSIDQGTTGTTVALVNRQGQMAFQYSEDFEQFYPQPGWVEHDAGQIWQTVLNGIKSVLSQASAANAKNGLNDSLEKKPRVVAIGITNQRETVLLWDKTSQKPLYHALVWQCRRTTSVCEKLNKNKALLKKVRQKTGLVIDPYFSATKISWLAKQCQKKDRSFIKKVKNSQIAAGTIDSFLLFKLSGGASHSTDVSNASRTLLMNIHTGEWDKDLLKIFQVYPQLLPEIKPSSGLFGVTQGVPGLPDGIPISGMAGDQQAALFGQACFKKGSAKCTFGTGSFILLNTGGKAVRSKKGLLTTIAWQLKDQKRPVYALEGGAFICGAAVQWLRDGLQFFKSSREVEELALQVDNTGGVEFVPALTGLGAPHWNPHARGLICGLTRGTTKAHIARATLEAMALQNVEILEAMQSDMNYKIQQLRVDGGATENNLLMQMQADYLGQKIERPKNIESTVLGAAFLAGLGVGFWKSTSEIQSLWLSDRVFTNKIKKSERLNRISLWRKALTKT